MGSQYPTLILCELSRVQNGPDRRIWDLFYYIFGLPVYLPRQLYEGSLYLTCIICELLRVQNGPDGSERRIWDIFFLHLQTPCLSPIELYESSLYLTHILSELSRVQNGPDGSGSRNRDIFWNFSDSPFMPLLTKMRFPIPYLHIKQVQNGPGGPGRRIWNLLLHSEIVQNSSGGSRNVFVQINSDVNYPVGYSCRRRQLPSRPKAASLYDASFIIK